MATQGHGGLGNDPVFESVGTVQTDEQGRTLVWLDEDSSADPLATEQGQQASKEGDRRKPRK